MTWIEVDTEVSLMFVDVSIYCACSQDLSTVPRNLGYLFTWVALVLTANEAAVVAIVSEVRADVGAKLLKNLPTTRCDVPVVPMFRRTRALLSLENNPRKCG